VVGRRGGLESAVDSGNMIGVAATARVDGSWRARKAKMKVWVKIITAGNTQAAMA